MSRGNVSSCDTWVARELESRQRRQSGGLTLHAGDGANWSPLRRFV
jgi:hypothetical protein